jgi:hypothetical protein
MTKAAERPLVDPTFYPVEDDMPQGMLYGLIIELLRPLVARWLDERGVRACVGADNFIYWVQHAPTICVAPDVYVMRDVDPGLAPGCWKLWEQGAPPSFALEVIGGDGRKDDVITPRRHDDLGTRELVIFDATSASGRPRFQVDRRDDEGRLALARHTDADRVRSRELGAWLRAVGAGDDLRLRLATGARGDTLVPTDAERADAERAARTREQAARERERAAREAAEAEVDRLRAEIERLRRG